MDFGLSYVRARQAADKVLIQDEMRRKVTVRLIEDVRTAFWRAVSADRLAGRLKTLEAKTKAILAATRQLSNTHDTSPVTALTYERELVEIKRTIGELEREQATAKSQLAALINVPPGSKFTLAASKHTHVPPHLKMPVPEMMQTALVNRAEVREVEYQKRINIHDADAAFLELLPGIQLVAGANFDSNDFLLNNNWVNWGAKASWNLIKVFSYPAREAVIDAQSELLDKRTLALSLAIMTQVHVSRVQFMHSRKELMTAQEYRDVQARLLDQIRSEATAGRVSQQTLVREELNTLVAEAKLDLAYSALENSYANVFASMGLDPFENISNRDVPTHELASELRRIWIERGDSAPSRKTAMSMQPR